MTPAHAPAGVREADRRRGDIVASPRRRSGGGPRPVADQHAARAGDRHLRPMPRLARGGRRAVRAGHPADRPARRVPGGAAVPETCRSSASAGITRPRTRSSSCWPAPGRCRSGPPSSRTRPRPSRPPRDRRVPAEAGLASAAEFRGRLGRPGRPIRPRSRGRGGALSLGGPGGPARPEPADRRPRPARPRRRGGARGERWPAPSRCSRSAWSCSARTGPPPSDGSGRTRRCSWT